MAKEYGTLHYDLAIFQYLTFRAGEYGLTKERYLRRSARCRTLWKFMSSVPHHELSLTEVGAAGRASEENGLAVPVRK